MAHRVDFRCSTVDRSLRRRFSPALVFTAHRIARSAADFTQALGQPTMGLHRFRHVMTTETSMHDDAAAAMAAPTTRAHFAAASIQRTDVSF
jgi:hypothetical protein